MPTIFKIILIAFNSFFFGYFLNEYLKIRKEYGRGDLYLFATMMNAFSVILQIITIEI